MAPWARAPEARLPGFVGRSAQHFGRSERANFVGSRSDES